MNEAEAVALLKQLVAINSGTNNKAGVDAVGDIVSPFLTALGFTEERIAHASRGDLRHFTVDNAPPRMLLCGHLDTVFEPDSGFLDVREDDEYLYGPGTFDMKGGIVVMLLALAQILKTRGTLQNIGVLLVPDEEQGSLAHRAQMEKIYVQYEYGLVFEGCAAQYSVIDRRRGAGFFTLRAEGKGGHSGYFANINPNAISMLAQSVGDVLALQDVARGTTINPGRIEGGTKPNIVAERASLVCDIRFWDKPEFERVHKGLLQIAEKHGLKLEMEDIFWPLEESPRMNALKKFVQDAAARLNATVTYIQRAGGSDASVMAACGMGVLDGWGVTGDGFHTIEEKMKKNSLTTQAAFTAETVLATLKG